MKRRPNTLKRTIVRIISGHLRKVKRQEDEQVKFDSLSIDDQMDIIEELQKLMDYEVQKQLKKVQKFREVIRSTRKV